MRIAPEEIFGPVISAIPFKGTDDLVARANSSMFGLGSGVWTKDASKAHRMVKAIRAAIVIAMPLCNTPSMWESGFVKRRFTIRHLLAALAWLGLLLAPLATPAAAMAVSMEMATAGVESSSMDMPEGMPCCPEQPAKPDCAKDCPFLAICAGMVFPVIAGGATLSVPIALLAVVLPRDDAKLSGLAQEPPAKPPKA